MRKKTTYAVITFGLGGFHAEAGEGWGSLSGYSRPEHFEKDLADPERFNDFNFEGAYALDIREAVSSRPMLGILAPLCRPSLPPGTVKKFNETVDLTDPITQAITKEFTRTSPTLRAAVAAHQFGSMDDVALDIYVEWWRSHGARVGRIEGDKINWEPVTEPEPWPTPEQGQLWGADHAES